MQIPSRIVLKTYPHPFKDPYEKERRAYAALGTKTSYVARCFGSFYWLSEASLRSNTLMLEYAEEGTLSNLFQRGQAPFEPSDIRMLWKAFLNMVKAVEMIHEQEDLRAYAALFYPSLRLRFHGQLTHHLCSIHQDLKPSNILVFPSHNAEEPFAYVFKVCDFATCYIPTGSSRSGYDPDAIHARAGRTYSQSTPGMQPMDPPASC